MNPYLGVDINKLSAAQRAERIEWQATEAQRLIDARRAIQRPAQPVYTNQIHDPRAPQSGPSVEQMRNTAMAAQLIEAMARRDRSNGNA